MNWPSVVTIVTATLLGAAAAVQAQYGGSHQTVPARSAAETARGGGATTGASTSAAPIAVADLNGDRRPDLVVINRLSRSVSVLLRRADGLGYETPVAYPVGPFPGRVAVADLNGDGRPDLVVTDGHSVKVLTQTAAGTRFVQTESYLAGSNPGAVAVGDLDGDGRPDLAVADYYAGTATVLLRNATSTRYGRAGA
jgi:hypothetical protein